MLRRLFAILLLALASPASAQEPPLVAAARAAATIGERFDGYIGYVAPPSAALRAQVDSINIRRRALYSNLAARRGVTPQEVGITAGCQVLPRVPVGGAYMLPDGQWRRRISAEQRVTPDYCG